MPIASATWVVILAGGEGERLRSLTTTHDGLAVPKQFCSLRGGPSLLRETLARAAEVSPPARTLVCVAAQHRRWWEPPLRPLPDRNAVVQPMGRGTGIGLLLPLLLIADRDPDAPIVVLPSDHYVRNEPVLADALRKAVRHVQVHPDYLLLLGIKPERPDTELGYIVPEPIGPDGVSAVAHFVEKPSLAMARDLIARGAVWNTFIIAARARELLQLFELRYPEIVATFRAARPRGLPGEAALDSLPELYRRLPQLDFSRDVLQGQERLLRVLRVPACGWSDLGTPGRVVETLRRLPKHNFPEVGAYERTAHLNLAHQYSRQQLAG